MIRLSVIDSGHEPELGRAPPGGNASATGVSAFGRHQDAPLPAGALRAGRSPNALDEVMRGAVGLECGGARAVRELLSLLNECHF